jgi:hypothetical protein
MKRKLRELWELWPVVVFVLVMVGAPCVMARGCSALVGLR